MNAVRASETMPPVPGPAMENISRRAMMTGRINAMRRTREAFLARMEATRWWVKGLLMTAMKAV